MKGIIFDMDGVLVDSMPSHVRAWQLSVKEFTNINVERKFVYRNEGRRSRELVKEILANYQGNSVDTLIIEKIVKRKSEIFKKNGSFKVFPGVIEIISNLECKKAVVSGSTKEDVLNIINQNFGNNFFDTIVTGDDITDGKPDPLPFRKALQELNLKANQVLVVENAPLGVQASKNAGIDCIVTLNNTPLSYEDFKLVIPKEKIFEDMKSANKFLLNWCN
ncbi:MAG: HAD family phosphatase [Nitrososphaeraceae archaeon]|nr:HAD family phosphatase [Nitrososphaeraceae archaeon]